MKVPGIGRRSALRAAVAIALAAGSTAVANALPEGAGAPGAAPRTGTARLLLAQGFSPGAGPGFGAGGQNNPGNSRGIPGGNLAQGRQGGGFPGGLQFTMAPGQTTQVAVFCTDLLSDPPDAGTRFAGGEQGRVILADGSSATLSEAIGAGIIAVRGRSNSFDPVRRDGSLALDLYALNASGQPLRVAIPAGTTITPAGQAEQRLPENAGRLFELAREKRIHYTNTMQYALWAARGSTAEEVEQTNLRRLPKEEIARVQELLDRSGIDQYFNRNPGLYAARFDEAREKLGDAAQAVTGHVFLADGTRADVEGARAADGSGVLALRPAKRGGEFFCTARFASRQDGRTEVRLFHQVTGKPVRVSRGPLLLHARG